MLVWPPPSYVPFYLPYHSSLVLPLSLAVTFCPNGKLLMAHSPSLSTLWSLPETLHLGMEGLPACPHLPIYRLLSFFISQSEIIWVQNLHNVDQWPWQCPHDCNQIVEHRNQRLTTQYTKNILKNIISFFTLISNLICN